MCKGLVIIYREGEGGGLVQIGGGSPLFIHGLKGGGGAQKNIQMYCQLLNCIAGKDYY